MSADEIYRLCAYISPFGLVAFMVIWHTLKVAPTMERRLDQARSDYLAAEDKARGDYLNALKEQRIDFTLERQHDRDVKKQLTESFNKLAELTQAHVLEARIVWQKRGELPPR